MVEFFVVVEVWTSLYSGDDESFVGLVRFLDELRKAEAADGLNLIAQDWFIIQVLLVVDLSISRLFQIFDEEKLYVGLRLVQ